MAARKKTTKTPVRAAAPTRGSRGRIRQEGASFPVPPSSSEMPTDYTMVLTRLKRRIATAQTRAALSVSRELVALYWHVGATIVQRQTNAGWGDAVVERLAHDLRHAFRDLEGFSPRNIWRMRAFYLAWSGAPKKLTQPVSETGARRATEKLPQAVSEIPWGHNIVLLKATAFKPEHAGKMNFYLSAVDDLLKHKDDQPSIGLLLCRSRNRVQVEYALRDIRKPIGVAQWETRIVEALPEDLRGSLPTVEELEAELSRGENER